MPYIEYVVFERDCLAGEVFSYRTEKYRPPTIIRSMTTVLEPSTGTYLYDAGLNTLPEDQGWSNTVNGSNPIPTVTDGVFYQNAIANTSTQNWFVEADPFDFDSDEYFILEAELKVTSSGYTRGENRWRAGYGLAIKDIDEQAIIIGISSNGVQMTNDSHDWQDSNSGSFLPFDTTSGFHVYRLTVSQGMAELEIDDVPVLSYSTDGPISPSGNWVPNSFRFGDLSQWVESETELHYVRVNIIPEPSAYIMLGMGIVALLLLSFRTMQQIHRR